MAVPVLQIQEEIVEVNQLILTERISERILEQIVDMPVPVPRILEEIVRQWTCSFPISGAHFRAHRGADG